jgi:hypothetical protein
MEEIHAELEGEQIGASAFSTDLKKMDEIVEPNWFVVPVKENEKGPVVPMFVFPICIPF